MTQREATIKKRANQEIFLEEFAKHGNISLACHAAEINRSTLYRWKEKSDTFMMRYNVAAEEAKDAIRAEIHRRGMEGWDEPVYQGGMRVGVIHRHSDTLLIFLAKSLMPEFRDKTPVLAVTLPKEYVGFDANADGCERE
jgi:hypothetical protein